MQHLTLLISSTNPRHITICQKYWALNDKRKFINRVPDICNQFQLSQDEVLAIIKQAVVTDLNTTCHICEQPKRYLSRYDYIKSYTYLVSYQCKACSEAIENNILQEFNQVKSCTPLALAEIGYEQAVYIYTALEFLQSFSSEHRTTPQSPIPHLNCIAHNHKTVQLILETAYATRYIIPRSLDDFKLLKRSNFHNTSMISIDWEANTNHWNVNRLQYEIRSLFLSRSRTTYYLIHNELCYEIAYQECLQCLNHVLKKHQITYKPSHGTKLIIHKGLSYLSVAKISHLIYQSVALSEHKYLLTPEQQTLPKGQLAIALLDQKITEYIKRRYLIDDYHRLGYEPQSYLSYILFDIALQQSDCGFYIPLSQLLT